MAHQGAGQGTEYLYRDATDDGSTWHHSFLLPPVLRALRDAGARSVLDVGCGHGAFTRRLSDAGFDTYGCDSSASGAAVANKHAPGRFVQASAYDDLTVLFKGHPRFDAVIAVEVIEHLFAPRDFVQRLHDALEPGGTVILTTPYHGYLKNVAVALSGKFDAHFSPLWDGGHIKFWSRRTLADLLREKGFRDIRFEGAGRLPFLWRAMVMSARRA